MGDLPAIPKVTIIDDKTGKQVFEPRVDSGPMQLVWNMAAAAQMARLNRYFADRQSIGEIETWEEQITDECRDFQLESPAQSLGIINDAASTGAVSIWINSLGTNKKTIAISETFNINFETHELRVFYLQSAPGTVANIRAVARR